MSGNLRKCLHFENRIVTVGNEVRATDSDPLGGPETGIKRHSGETRTKPFDPKLPGQASQIQKVRASRDEPRCAVNGPE
jgi:hypothetical protein